MNTTVKLLLIVTLMLSIIIPFGYFLIGQKTKKRYKRAIGTNVFFFFGACLEKIEYNSEIGLVFLNKLSYY